MHSTNVSFLYPLSTGINDGTGYMFTGILACILTATAEHINDYIQFASKVVRWTSTTAEGKARCNSGAWDPRKGLVCGEIFVS